MPPPIRLLLVLIGLSIASTSYGLDPHLSLRQYGRQSWQTDNGLPQNTVRAVLQSRDGYLWLATDGGLVRFDGVRFTVYERQTGDQQPAVKLRSNAINSLFEDRSGVLWISTADGLIRRSGTEFQTFTTADGLPGNSVSAVYQDRSGRLWVLTAEGAAAFDGVGRFVAVASGGASSSGSGAIAEAPDGSLWIGTSEGVIRLKDGKVLPLPGGMVRGETQAIAVSSDGRVWIGTRSGLQIVNGSRVTTLTRAQGLQADEITALLQDRSGRMWVGTAMGLAAIRSAADESKGEWHDKVDNYSAGDGLPGERIQSLFQDREGAIWAGTDRGAARLLDHQPRAHFESLGPREGLSGAVVLSMYEDREGSLWLGTESGGLTVLHDQKFTTYTTENGLSENLVRSVYQDRAGVVWIGTNGGGLDQRIAGAGSGASTFKTLSTADGLSSNIVLALADGPAGDLWIGTPDGLDRLRNGHITVYTSADGLADDFVRSLFTAADGTIWIGTRRGLSHLVNGQFTSYNSMDGLGSNFIGALLGQPDGSLWIGTLGGLSRLENGRFSTLTTRDGLSSNVVTALYRGTGGALWIGTSGGGLNLLRNGIVTALPVTGLPENIYSILEDGKQNLWLSSDKGIYRVGVQGLENFASGSRQRIAVASYGTADGMAISECSSGGHPAAWRLRDGTLAFATLKGVAMIDPENAPVNTAPPPVAIEQVTFDDRIVSYGPADGDRVAGGDAEPNKALALPPGQGRLVFDYTAMSFIAPQKVRFRYRLEGFDHGWVDAGTRRTAFYTNIPPGHYVFRVQACNNDRVWNEAGASLRLRLRPHFYQTWIFDVLLVLLAGLAGVLIYRRAYRRRVQRVEAQFGAVLAERGRIAREIHDTLAQSLVAISTQLEIVSRLFSPSPGAPAGGLTSGAAREHLDQARALTRSSLTEARSSIWNLRSEGPSEVAGAGAELEDLATRMSLMAARVTASTAIKIQSKVGGAYHPLPAKLQTELLRIAQEAVTNAVRHANPEHITIDLRFEARLLRMTIEDDGCGFSGQPHSQSSGPTGHFGLTGMKERAAEIGGVLAVESALGQGTLISLEVPID